MTNLSWTESVLLGALLSPTDPVLSSTVVTNPRVPRIVRQAFMSWFGPKGVATMTFSLLGLSDRISAGTKIFNLAALTAFCSIIVHGVTDSAGADWIAKRSEPDLSAT